MIGSADGVEEPHWITEVYVVDDQDNFISLKTLDPTGVDQATFEFSVPENAQNLTAYIWCNIHGLYAGPTVNVTSIDSTEGALSGETEVKANSASAVLAFVSSSVVAVLVAQFM